MATSCGIINIEIRTGKGASGFYTGEKAKKMTPFQAKMHYDHFVHSLNTLKSKGIVSNYLVDGENKWTFEEFIKHRRIELNDGETI